MTTAGLSLPSSGFTPTCARSATRDCKKIGVLLITAEPAAKAAPEAGLDAIEEQLIDRLASRA